MGVMSHGGRQLHLSWKTKSSPERIEQARGGHALRSVGAPRPYHVHNELVSRSSRRDVNKGIDGRQDRAALAGSFGQESAAATAGHERV